jgi:hypothetical protein
VTDRLKEICSRLIVHSGLDELESKDCLDNAFRTHNDIDEQIRSIKSTYNRQERHIFDKELKKERSEKSVKESSRKQKKKCAFIVKVREKIKNIKCN